MLKFMEGFADRMTVPAGARDVQVFDDELPGFGIRKFARATPPTSSSTTLAGSSGARRWARSCGAISGRCGWRRPPSWPRHGWAPTCGCGAGGCRKDDGDLGRSRASYPAAREAGDDGFRKPATRALSSIGRYLAGTKQSLPAWKPLHNLPIDSITHRHVQSQTDDLARSSGKVVADHARAALSGLFAWAIAKRYADSNPTLNVLSQARRTARERVLTEAELISIWKACLEDDYGRDRARC